MQCSKNKDREVRGYLQRNGELQLLPRILTHVDLGILSSKTVSPFGGPSPSGIFYHSHLRRSDHSAIQGEAFLLGDENRAILLPLHFRLKGRFVKIGVKPFLLFTGIETL